MFETRSQSWEEVGLLDEVRPGVARRARFEALLLAVLFVAIVVLWHNRRDLIDKSALEQIETPLAIVVVVALLVLGWAIARDVGRGLKPALFRRMEPATAGSVGFLIRLLTVAVALLIALDVAGVNPAALLLGGAFTAVIVGLAAQQTLGNVIAGTVLLSAGPFRVGDRVRLQGGQIAGQIDGIVSSLGLLYTTLATDDGLVNVPNSVVLNVAVVTRRGGVGRTGPEREEA
ncbi:MAG TPA: mechanosensitive ion channel domain-containing protein [Solirubrobacteraceae bacterium]|jgi:small-conductance mechanosensitive channel